MSVVPETPTRPQLDERTKAELQPPCDNARGQVDQPDEAWTRCDLPAEWVVRLTVRCCDAAGSLLMCAEHKREYVDLHCEVSCASCGSRSVEYDVIGLERL